jgi:serine/alanine adding enzyme
MSYTVSNFNAQDWDRVIASLPNPQLLQTWEWGSSKSQYEWSPQQLVWYKGDRIVAAALMLKRSLRTPFFLNDINMIYIPKGPLLDWGNPLWRQEVLTDIHDYAKITKSFFLKMDPGPRPR